MVQDLFRHLRTNATPVGEMKSLDARQQLLVILMEECGELIQECSKNLRRGELFDRQKFKDEVGDVYTMIDLLHEWDVVSWDEIEKRREVKRKKLSKWSDLINETDLEEDRLRKGYEAGVDWDNGDGGELYERGRKFNLDYCFDV